MKSRPSLLIAVGIAVFALAAAVALSKSITCSSNPCDGTDRSDNITGTANPDVIHALDGDDFVGALQSGDEVYGGNGTDNIYGDGGADRNADGDDKVYGGPGSDQMLGAGANDLLVGGRGGDQIDAREDIFAGDPPVPGVDTIKGGDGADYISASEGTPAEDHINCGPGKHDRVFFNQGLDTVRHCERKFPQ